MMLQTQSVSNPYEERSLLLRGAGPVLHHSELPGAVARFMRAPKDHRTIRIPQTIVIRITLLSGN